MDDFDFAKLDKLDSSLKTYAEECRELIDIFPNSSIITAGTFCERMTLVLFKKHGMECPEDQVDRLRKLEQNNLLPSGVLKSFHKVRQARNRATHAAEISTPEKARSCWEEICNIGDWAYKKYCREKKPVPKRSPKPSESSSSVFSSDKLIVIGLALIVLLYLGGAVWCLLNEHTLVGGGMLALPLAGLGAALGPRDILSKIMNNFRGMNPIYTACIFSLLVLTAGAGVWCYTALGSLPAALALFLLPAAFAFFDQFRRFGVKQLIMVYLSTLACFLLVEYCFLRHGIWGGLFSAPLLPGAYFALKAFAARDHANGAVSALCTLLACCIVGVLFSFWKFGLANGAFVLCFLLCYAGAIFFAHTKLPAKNFRMVGAAVSVFALLVAFLAWKYGVWQATKGAIAFLALMPFGYYMLRSEFEKAMMAGVITVGGVILFALVHNMLGLAGPGALLLAAVVTAACFVLAYLFRHHK